MKKLLGVACAGLLMGGCAAHINVSEPIAKGAKVAIVEFADCEKGKFNECEGSGKVASKIYSEVFGGPVLSSVSPDSKGFDVVIGGKMVFYNKAMPLMFNPNASSVDLSVKRLSDGKILATQVDLKNSNNLTGDAPDELTRKLAQDLKEKLGL